MDLQGVLANIEFVACLARLSYQLLYRAYLLCKLYCRHSRHGSVNASASGADAYNWCTVHESSYDVILFPAIAVVLACLFQGRYSTTLVLLAGALSTLWCPQQVAWPF